MPTTHQHYVPRAYLKAWQTQVRNSREPDKRFDGVYIIDSSQNKGEGANIKSVLWSQSIYTVKFQDYFYLHGKYPSLDKEFISGIKNILQNEYDQSIDAECDGVQIVSDQDILNNLTNLDKWEFKYADGNVAPKKRIINRIQELNSYCLEDGLDQLFEKDWQTVCNSFIDQVDETIPSKDGTRQIDKSLAERMVRFLFSMLCRNPGFDSFGIYKNLEERLLKPIGMTDEMIDEIMRPQWLGELYRMLYGATDGFFNTVISQTFCGCQMILFHRYEDTPSFITSDNPAFMYISKIDRENGNGVYFPLTPDCFLFVAKGSTNSIDKIDYRFADDKTVRLFNSRIYNQRTKLVVSKQRYLQI